MTHDELIAYIDDSTDGLKHEDIFPLLLANTQALRAVVELHKPWNTDRFGEPIDICVGCFDVTDDHIVYPCPTIQAIEKELA
jgi:hypothetical protein